MWLNVGPHLFLCSFCFFLTHSGMPHPIGIEETRYFNRAPIKFLFRALSFPSHRRKPERQGETRLSLHMRQSHPAAECRVHPAAVLLCEWQSFIIGLFKRAVPSLSLGGRPAVRCRSRFQSCRLCRKKEGKNINEWITCSDSVEKPLQTAKTMWHTFVFLNSGLVFISVVSNHV